MQVLFNNFFYISTLFILYFLSLILCSIFRRWVGTKGIFLLNTTFNCLLLLLLLLLFQDIIFYQKVFNITFFIVKCLNLGLDISIKLRLDTLSYFFILLVCLIGFLTNLYILNYFKYEANEDSFILLINWFIISMIILLLADNFFTLFLGWELIGLTSFLLINFWNNRRGTLKASFKAFLFNKISDLFLFFFLILLWSETKLSVISLINFHIYNNNYIYNINWFYIGLSLLICTSIKSAQLIGHLWLPDSMEAPVPASALIHSATLVSAGIYLLLRFNILIDFINFHFILVSLGSITAAYGGIVAASQTDLKKILAYSTISHCGFLFVCIGLQNFLLVIIYLFLHGIFKAATFFCAGSFIRLVNSQDTRQMGVLSRFLPLETIFLIICASNLGGLPFTFGYLYKSYFITIVAFSPLNFINVGFCIIGLTSSLVYIYRLIYYTVFDINKSNINISLKQLQNIQINKKYLLGLYYYQIFIQNWKKYSWGLSTFVQFIIMGILFFFSIYIYSIFIHLIENSSVNLSIAPNLDLISYPKTSFFFNKNFLFYKNFYYVIYTLILSIILIIECRKTYTWTNRMYFFIFLLFFFCMISILNFIYILINKCEHIFC